MKLAIACLLILISGCATSRITARSQRLPTGLLVGDTFETVCKKVGRLPDSQFDEVTWYSHDQSDLDWSVDGRRLGRGIQIKTLQIRDGKLWGVRDDFSVGRPSYGGLGETIYNVRVIR